MDLTNGSGGPGPISAGENNSTISQANSKIHSARGLRHALEKTARKGSSLKDQLPDATNFAGKGFRKPNYFAQGGQRHGMHVGAGAPFVGPAENDTGANFGG